MLYIRHEMMQTDRLSRLGINECYDDYDRKSVIETTDHAFKITLPDINFCTEGRKAPNNAKTGGSIRVIKRAE